MCKQIFLLLILAVASGQVNGRLTAKGRQLLYNGQQVFLNGANIAWYSYGYDFGNNQYANSKGNLTTYLTKIAAAGGNSIRKLAITTCHSSSTLHYITW